MITLKQELGRKTFHFFASIVPLAYLFLNRWEMILFVSLTLAASLIVDLGRLFWGPLQRLFQFMFGRWLRASEFQQLTGATFFLIGSLLTVLIFPAKQIVIPALLFLSLGDLAAALIGKRWGRVKIIDSTSKKTLEGSLACFAVCFSLSLFFVDWPTGLAGALAATIAEVLPVRLNDNVSMPVCGALAMFLIEYGCPL